MRHNHSPQLAERKLTGPGTGMVDIGIDISMWWPGLAVARWSLDSINVVALRMESYI